MAVSKYSNDTSEGSKTSEKEQEVDQEEQAFAGMITHIFG
jgi:hypothetical protein